MDHGFASFEFGKLPFAIETSGAWSVKAVALWKRIKASHKVAVAHGFASATFLGHWSGTGAPHRLAPVPCEIVLSVACS